MSEGMRVEHQQLLRNLKSTVEGLLNTQATYVWNIYGGLNRLYADLERIFSHRCKGNSKKEDGKFWQFIEGLAWLQPDTLHNSIKIDAESRINLPAHVKHDKSSVWLFRSLENHSLAQKLSWLVSDDVFVRQCYDVDAFLSQTQYAQATIVCLNAVEFNQASLISEIPPKLFVSNERIMKKSWRTHRRCVSLPITQQQQPRHSLTFHELIMEPITRSPSSHQTAKRPWKSLPLLEQEEVDGNVIEWRLRQKNNVQIQRKHILIDNNVIEHTPPERGHLLQASSSPMKRFGASAPEFSLLATIADAEKLPRKTMVAEGSSVLPTATRYFPKPTKGQSLTSFLITSQQSRGNAELDRENAHFNICEAVIAAMEQIKSNKALNMEDSHQDESDEEINFLKQKIRLRRRQKLEESQMANSEEATITSVCSPDVLSTSSSTSCDEDSVEIDIFSNLQDDSGMSMSMASLYSESDIATRPRGVPDGASDVLSAEGVALSLISKFNEKQLPRASDLEWLVSEEDAPQALLPLPKHWMRNNEEFCTPLRGTTDWAPPRPQIIFTLHSMPSRTKLMEKQNYRCAGCGMRVAKKYAFKFRYCNYLSRYFCTGCHTNKVAIIPARVLHQWNFKRYTVSTFSYQLIEQIYTDPLFRVFELNANIGQYSRNLAVCTKYRKGIKLLKDYILTCRFAASIQEFLTSEPTYVFNEPGIYSLEDLVNVRTGEMKNKLKLVAEICCRHCTECELCTARGFICEICKKPEILFPWQQRIVSRCTTCGSCYHIHCWSQTHAPCSKCTRDDERKGRPVIN